MAKKATNEKVLEQKGAKMTPLNNMLHSKSNWIGHILRRNCLLLHYAIEGQMAKVKV